MDAFAVSVSNSMALAGLKKSEAVLTSLCFGVFQGLMPTVGFLAGRAFARAVSAFDHWIAFCLLGFLGGKMLADAVRELRCPEVRPARQTFSLRLVLTQAFATSIDALAAGVSLAALEGNIFAAAGFIACVTFVCCLVGHALGRRFGGWLGARAQIFGGLILVLLGVRILAEHLLSHT